MSNPTGGYTPGTGLTISDAKTLMANPSAGVNPRTFTLLDYVSDVHEWVYEVYKLGYETLSPLGLTHKIISPAIQFLSGDMARTIQTMTPPPQWDWRPFCGKFDVHMDGFNFVPGNYSDIPGFEIGSDVFDNNVRAQLIRFENCKVVAGLQNTRWTTTEFYRGIFDNNPATARQDMKLHAIGLANTVTKIQLAIEHHRLKLLAMILVGMETMCT